MNTIRTDTLVLEPQLTAHAAEMFDVLSDPAIYEFENSPPESLGWLERRFAGLESRLSPNGEEQWLNWVIRLPTGVLAGYVQASVAKDHTAHVAYELGSKFWRKGIGTAAVSAMLEELAARYAVRTFVATLKARNYRSRAFLKKLGFAPRAPPGVRAVSAESDEIVMYRVDGT